mgnify:CR=1 FL=1
MQESPLLGMPKKITALVDNESARGKILILAAYLDELLTELIQYSCVSEKAANKILDYRAPGGDFDSKIILCASFAFIHESEEKALNAIRKIRNKAAHFDKKGKGFDVLFDAEQTYGQVCNLGEALNLTKPSRETEEVEDYFVMCCRLLATKLMIRGTQAVRPEPKTTVKEMANAFRNEFKHTPQGAYLSEIEENMKKGDLSSLGDFFKGMKKAFKDQLANSKNA